MYDGRVDDEADVPSSAVVERPVFRTLPQKAKLKPKLLQPICLRLIKGRKGFLNDLTIPRNLKLKILMNVKFS